MPQPFEGFLWDWAGKLVCLLIVCAALACLYGLGRWHGRLAERRDRAVFEAEVGEMFGDDTVDLVPLQRQATQ
jgi:hypothetical protein